MKYEPKQLPVRQQQGYGGSAGYIESYGPWEIYSDITSYCFSSEGMTEGPSVKGFASNGKDEFPIEGMSIDEIRAEIDRREAEQE